MKTMQKKGAKIAPKKTTEKVQFVNGSNGLELATIGGEAHIPENVGADAIKKAKKQSLLIIERKNANNARLDKIESLSQILKDVKLYGGAYLKVIEEQYSVKVTQDMLNEVIPSMFLHMQSEREKEIQAKNPNRWKFSKVLTLIARYYKQKLATEKLAIRTEKALSKLEA